MVGWRYCRRSGPALLAQCAERESDNAVARRSCYSRPGNDGKESRFAAFGCNLGDRFFETVCALGDLPAPELDFDARPHASREFQHRIDFMAVGIAIMPHVPAQGLGENAEIVHNRLRCKM